MTTLQNVTYGPMVRGERNQKDIENAAMELLRKVVWRSSRINTPPSFLVHAEACRTGQSTYKYPEGDDAGRAFQRARRHDKRVDAGVLCSTIEEHGITNLFVTSEIEEAIFLADRLMILTNLPAKVRTVMEIKLPGLESSRC